MSDLPKLIRKLFGALWRILPLDWSLSQLWPVKQLLATGTAKTLREYWRLYGGWQALVRSWFVWSALLITILASPFWRFIENGSRPWAQTAVEVVPSLLGFSMGGMAIMLAFSRGAFFRAVTQRGRKDSFFMKAVANFFHFILFQTVTLVFVFLAKAYPDCSILSAVGFFLLAYSVLVALAVASQLLRTAQLFNASSPLEDDVPAPKAGHEKQQGE